MILQERIERYLFEANRHISHIESAKEELNVPVINYDDLSKLEKFALNTLIFRFSKLQDLIGTKLFRYYLDYSGLYANDMGFFDLLKEIEKEGIVDIDTWQQLRELRNDIAHEYPHEMAEMLEKINLLIEKSEDLIVILRTIEAKYHETKRQRD